MTNAPGVATVVDSKTPRIELNNSGYVLTFNLTAQYHILGRDPQQPLPIGFKVPEDWLVVSRHQACFRKVGKDYFIFDGDGEKASSNRLFINNTIILPKEGYPLRNGDEIKISQNPQKWVTITYFDPSSVQAATTPKQQSISLKNRSVILGRSPDANLQLDASTVSRHHATIDADNRGRYVVRDLSTNGVFVDGQRVAGLAVLSQGAVLRIGPYTFVLQGDELVLFDRGNNIRLDAKNLVRFVKGKHKQTIGLLNDISLAIEPGQFAAIVGGSGSGKSMLMKTLLGIEPTNQGTVYLNGDDLRSNFGIYRTLIGYVPQYDIVHTSLTVKEVLYYAAKLRLPPDVDVPNLIQKTLEQVELSERRDTLVKSLSGGQLRRVSIGVELLADPKLFFLDEPTSGLDPGLDKKMMLLLRQLATEGRTVILVTHATANITLCDRLVFMGLGGNLCYFGPSDEAIKFFQINSGDFADIYVKLETKESVNRESDRFSQSDYRKEYIENRLSQVTQEPHASTKTNRNSFLQRLSISIQQYFQQLPILIQRYAKLIIRDPVFLGLSLLTAPIGIGLVTLVVLDKTPLVGSPDYARAALARQVLFVITCAGIWVGFAGSLQEIVKESAIYMRERLVNLGLFSYLSSKVFTLGGLAILQSLLISITILLGFKSPESDSDFIPWSFLTNIAWPLGVFITTFLTVMASVSLGLMVSAGVKNGSQANSALPLLLLPQIIFSGVLFDMGSFGRYISWLMLSRWSVGAYGTLADVNILVPLPQKDEGGNLIDVPIKTLPMFDHTLENLALNFGILLVHIIIYLGVAFWLQKRKDILNN